MTETSFFHSTRDNYWDTYLAARPDYTQSGFYERVLDYHRTHGNGSFDRAHDVACGPGNVAAVLREHFASVVASDPNQSHVDAARQRLTGDAEHASDKLIFVQSTGEDISAHEQPGSVDFIAVAEAIALMDMPRSLDAFAHILRPGGTLALWFYGRPHFVTSDAPDAALDNAANTAYLALADFMFGPLVRGNPGAWASPTQHMHAWFDDVAVPDRTWAHVERTKWNSDLVVPFYSPDLGGLDARVAASVVGAHEKLAGEADRRFWGKSWTAEEARTFLKVNMPYFDHALLESEEAVRLFGELERCFGGPGGTRSVAWPVVLITATRK